MATQPLPILEPKLRDLRFYNGVFRLKRENPGFACHIRPWQPFLTGLSEKRACSMPAVRRGCPKTCAVCRPCGGAAGECDRIADSRVRIAGRCGRVADPRRLPALPSNCRRAAAKLPASPCRLQVPRHQAASPSLPSYRLSAGSPPPNCRRAADCRRAAVKLPEKIGVGAYSPRACFTSA